MTKWVETRFIDVQVVPSGGGYDITPFEGKTDLKAHELQCSKDSPDPLKKEPIWKEGCHVLVFRIQNEDGAQLRFVEEPEQAFWAHQAQSGSTSGPSSSSQIEDCVPALVSGDGSELVVVNFNRKKKRIGYTLRLIDTNQHVHVCDPIMGNTNGGSRAPAPVLDTNLVSLGLAVGAGALLAGLAFAIVGAGDRHN